MGLPGLRRALPLACAAWLAACAADREPGAWLGEQSRALRPDVADGGLPQPLYEPGSTLLA
ncbi:MAG TPA: hypothetical protein VFZ61_24905, partial [Polyangiales bacterium]